MSVMGRRAWICCELAILGTLVACGSAPRQPAPAEPQHLPSAAASNAPQTALSTPASVIIQARSRWVAADWSELPGVAQDQIDQAWNAWLKSCERSAALPSPLAALCPQVRALSIASRQEQLAWLQSRLQP
jgi:membrane-bound lytic murein transglycosylase A